MPNDDPDYGGFPVAVTIPARTRVAEVEACWVAEDEELRGPLLIKRSQGCGGRKIRPEHHGILLDSNGMAGVIVIRLVLWLI